MSDQDVKTKVVLDGDVSGLINAFRLADEQNSLLRDSILATSSTIGELSGAITKAAGLFTGLFAGLAAGSGLSHLVSEAVDWNTEVTRMAATLGMTTQEASGFQSTLEHLGIEQDTVTNAMQKMIKTATSSPQVFKKLGIDITDVNGKLLPTSEIFKNVITRLGEYESGSSRAGAASLIFGKGTHDLSLLMKLTSDEIDGGAERVKNLGMVVTKEGSEKAIQYRKDLNDLKGVFHSMAYQIGNEVIPQLDKLGKAYVDGGENKMGAFQKGLLNTEIGAYRSMIALDMFGQAVANTLNILDGAKLLKTITGDSNWEVGTGLTSKITKDYEEIQKLINRRNGLNEDGSKPQPYKPQDEKGKDKLGPSDVQMGKSDWMAAHNKYLEYLKAFEETKADFIKNAASLEQVINQHNYDIGLTDLRSFLEEKNALQEESLYAEVDARRKELNNANAALHDLKPVTDSKGQGNPSKDAENYHEALLRQQTAVKALADSEAKLGETRLKNGFGSTTQIMDQTRAYQELQAQFLDMQNDFVGASAIRAQLASSDEKLAQMEVAALAGNKDAEAAVWGQYAKIFQMKAEGIYKQIELTDQLKIQILEMAGSYEAAAIAKKKLEVSSPAFQSLPPKVQELRTQILDQGIPQGAIKDQTPINQLNTQLMELKGNYLEAAKARQAFEMEGEAYQHLSPEDKAKQQDIWKRQNAGLTNSNSVSSGMSAGLNEFLKSATNTGEQVKNVMEHAFSGATDALVKFCNTGKLNFDKFTQGVIVDIETVMIKRAMAGLVDTAIGGMGFSSLFGGGKATGGPVMAGTTYLVGENGPEMFTPPGNGTIIPNNFLNNSGGGDIHIHLAGIDARGADQGVEAKIQRGIATAVDQARAAVLQDFRRGGPTSKAAGSRS
jgi:hypothetical protein